MKMRPKQTLKQTPKRTPKQTILAFCLLCAAVCAATGAQTALAIGGFSTAPETTGYDAAKALIYAGEYTKGLAAMRTHVSENPGDADGWNMIGYAERKSGNSQAAFDAYQKALDLEPHHMATKEYLGHWYLEHDQRDEAVALLEKLKAFCAYCAETEALERAINSAIEHAVESAANPAVDPESRLKAWEY